MGDPHDAPAALARFLAERLGARSVEVTGFEQKTEGFSQETFAVECAVDFGARQREPRAYVVKREPAAGILEPYDLEPEFRVLHALAGCDIAAPATPWFERTGAVLGRPFYVMERLGGEVPIPAPGPSGQGPFATTERAALAPQVVGQLARLHAVDWRRLGLDFLAPPTGTTVAARELRRWRTRMSAAAFAMHPMLAYALAWLERNTPEDADVTIVHGDYRTGNFLVVRDGERTRLTGILDWELVHAGDPVEDVAWATSRLWRAQTPYAGGLAPPEDFVRAYEQASGRTVERERLRFYEVLAVVKMLAIMLTGIRAFADGRTRDLRMAIFDHQVPFLHALLGVELGLLPDA